MKKEKQESMVSKISTVVMAVILAVGLWFYAYWKGNSTEVIELPLQITSSQDVAVIPVQKDLKIKVKIGGPKSEVERIKNLADEDRITAEFRYQVKQQDLQQPEKRETIFLNPDMIMLKSGAFDISNNVKIQEPPTPSSVEVDVSKIITKSVKVKLTFKGTPEEGYSVNLDETYYVPRTVDITGPQKVLDNMNEISTVPINVDKKESSFIVDNVKLADAPGTETSLSNANVYVKVVIARNLIKQEFRGNPIYVIDVFSDPFIYELVDVKTVEVTLQGTEEDLNKVTKDDILLFIDVRNLDKQALYEKGTPTNIQVKCYLLKDNVALQSTLPTVKLEVNLPEMDESTETPESTVE